MASFINTNMVSLNTQNNLSKSQDALAQSIKRLSTGLRINSAKDDAAGLAISNRMDATIRGQTVAIRNTNDAVSFSQTADGALAQINNNLQRLRELAVQASNGTNSAGDRELLNTEFNQLQQEVARIQNNTAFNGTNAMQSNSVTVQIGAGTTQYDKISISGIDLTKVTQATTTDAVVSNTFTRAQFDAEKAQIAKTNSARAANLFFNESNGHVYEIVKTNKNLATATADAGSSKFGTQSGYIATISNAEENNFVYNKTGGNWTWINGGDAEPTVADPSKGEGKFFYDGLAPEKGAMTYKNFGGGEPNNWGNEDAIHLWGGGSWNDLSINAGIWSAVEYGGIGSTTASAASTAPLITTIGTGSLTRGTYQVDDGATVTVTATMQDASSDPIPLYKTAAGVATSTSAPGVVANTLTSGQLFYVAPTSGQTDYAASATYSAAGAVHQVNSTSQKAAASDLQIFGNASGVNILTQADALSAIDSLDKAMLQVNVAQIQQGATQNRLSAIISTLTSSNESTINARSHIMDTDFAAETASMARAQILQQAGMAMLAQANTSNNGIMALMR
jgi:flagellin